MFDLKAFVRSISGKRSQPAVEGVSKKGELIAKLLQAAKEELKREGKLTEEAESRAKMTELILPSCITTDADGNPLADKKRVKQWAYAMSHHIGLLAALSMPEDDTHAAMVELLAEAEDVAKATRTMLEQLGASALIPKPPRKSKSEPAQAVQAVTTEKLRMIEDLKSQAELETDAAAKVALLQVAKRMEKELELEKAST